MFAMKRFLSGGTGPVKRAKLCEMVPKSDPVKIIAWNVQSLPERGKKDMRCVKSFLRECGADVVFLSEVKLKAHCSTLKAAAHSGPARNRRKPQTGDATGDREEGVCRELLRDVGFAPPVFSLADTRYAGTCALFRESGPAPVAVFFDFPDVTALGLRRATTSFGEAHYANGDDGHVDGRVLVCEYATVVVLHAYAPNNGSDVSKFARRATWEARVRTWVEAVTSWGLKDLVYVGDLNVAPGVLNDSSRRR